MDRWLASSALLLHNLFLFMLAALVELLAEHGRRQVRPVFFLAIVVWTLPALVAIYRTAVGRHVTSLMRAVASSMASAWVTLALTGAVAAGLGMRLGWSLGLLAQGCVAVAALVQGWSLSRRLRTLTSAALGGSSGGWPHG